MVQIQNTVADCDCVKKKEERRKKKELDMLCSKSTTPAGVNIFA